MEQAKFVKHFCRLLSQEEISDEDAVAYFDIVQSICHPKLSVGIDASNAEKVSVDIIVYTSETDNLHVYEIILNEDITTEEGDNILRSLYEEFDFDFDFEASTKV